MSERTTRRRDSGSDTTWSQSDALVPLIFRTARVLSGRMREGSPDVVWSMTSVHLFALRYLADHALVTNGELARHLDVTKQATSELIAGLESAGIVRRASHPDDGRARVLELTPEGKELLAEGHRRWTQIQDEWIALLGPRRVATVQKALQDFLAAAGDPPQRPSS
jgi:DNA-binding MarR family transcriptional regulator